MLLFRLFTPFRKTAQDSGRLVLASFGVAFFWLWLVSYFMGATWAHVRRFSVRKRTNSKKTSSPNAMAHVSGMMGACCPGPSLLLVCRHDSCYCAGRARAACRQGSGHCDDRFDPAQGLRRFGGHFDFGRLPHQRLAARPHHHLRPRRIPPGAPLAPLRPCALVAHSAVRALPAHRSACLRPQLAGHWGTSCIDIDRVDANILEKNSVETNDVELEEVVEENADGTTTVRFRGVKISEDIWHGVRLASRPAGLVLTVVAPVPSLCSPARACRLSCAA